MSSVVTRSAGALRVGRPPLTTGRIVAWSLLLILAGVLLAAPAYWTTYGLSNILTKSAWMGIAAASIIFLAKYAGMVSLGQVGLYAIAGFTTANLVHASEGTHVGLTPWLAVFIGIAVCLLFGFLFGLIAARSYGIYFLMITLAFAVIVYYFFGQVTQLSGFGGVRNIARPGFLGNPITQPTPLYYVALGCSVGVFLLIKYLVRTPFGLAMQGIRDDPTRMRALGYNVELHRALAFTMGAFIASIAGILSIWFNTQISPGAIGIGQTIDVLIVAVIGGLYRLEGAWIGAIFFTLVDDRTRAWTPTVGAWLDSTRFETIIGIIFLIIVLLSPGGLMGIYESLKARAIRTYARRGPVPAAGVPAAPVPPARPPDHAEPASTASNPPSGQEKPGGR